MKVLLKFFFQIYRACMTPFFGPACRFGPSCSHYAEEALIKKGVLRGTWLAVKRISKCQPFHPGGYDPVEE